ncbi:F-box/LRR-repeat protein, partial [Trifolium medium]|nr:F-box/LRR-repeat protein [Trifolium medium]
MDAIMFSPHSQHVPLKSFHLKFRNKFWGTNADCSTFDKWFEAAKQRRVKYLNLLNIPLVPTNIFCCKTLVILRLMNIRVANMFCCSVDLPLPLLKTWDLYKVGFDDMENLMRLISGCPVLENLKTSFVEVSAGVTAGGYFKPLSNLIKADFNLFEVPLRAVYNVQFLTICQ